MKKTQKKPQISPIQRELRYRLETATNRRNAAQVLFESSTDSHDFIAAKLARLALDHAANEIAEIHILLLHPKAGSADSDPIHGLTKV